MLSDNLPRISVVTPAFSAGLTIEVTMRSVIEQSYPNLEYIVMDGGSTDQTVQIIERYASHLTRWCTGPDGGQYDAIDQGFSYATGDIFCWLNSDDIFLPRSLWIASEIFRQFPEIEWISTLKPGFWDANSYFIGTASTPGFAREAFLDGLYLPGTKTRGYWIQQESTFWRRSLWEKVGAHIPRPYPMAGDFALWAAFYLHADLYGVEYPIAGFRFLEGQRSEELTKYIEEGKRSLAALRAEFNWKESALNKYRYGKIRRIPRLGSYLAKRFGYVGRRIVNRNNRKAGSGWKIETYQFLP
jgi:glycosyltransferase involved in cell wall biosynthesis